MPEKEKAEVHNNLELEFSVNKEEFNLFSQDDFLRVDNLCKGLLLRFYEQLQREGLSPQEATVLAGGADYFIRDFVVDFKMFNIFDEMPGIVRQFAGNWFIINSVEPDIALLSRHLRGIRAFYHFLYNQRLISAGFLWNIENECDDLTYYETRIASFMDIEGDGYFSWDKECSLQEGDEKGGNA